MKINKDITVHTWKTIRNQLTKQELDDTVADFRQYKDSSLNRPSSFGRDVPYDHPNNPPSIKNEDVYHIHMVDYNEWDWWITDFNRTSDKHLVYCPAALQPDTYLLITMLDPNAHEQARNSTLMRDIGDVAQKFRSKF